MDSIRLPGGRYQFDPTHPLGPPGGFGQVFAGRTDTGAEVAVKRLHLDVNQLAHRELTMAIELARRSLANVLPFIDAGQDAETEACFVVMELAAGSLQDEVANGSVLAARDAAAVMLQIARGLVEVGDIVHRDLKPANVLRHENRWKIADFGIARFIEEATASNTLRRYLSPEYAAPEQWRGERATHATDVYALGCIGFFVLTGNSPFRGDPEHGHLGSPLPDFACTDPRLKSLILMMARKKAEARPSLSRVVSQLEQIATEPLPATPGNAIGMLAEAGASAAIIELAREADAARSAADAAARSELAKLAHEVLRENAERLWGKIHAAAPAAKRTTGNRSSDLMISVGTALLALSFGRGVVPRSEFRESGWDVVASAVVRVAQSDRGPQWASSLWYVRLPGAADFRWMEVGYFAPFSAQDAPFACEVGRDADLAAAPILHSVAHAFGPTAIDDEDESSFHERWVWLLAQAASGSLQRPSRLPIKGWPPR